MADTIRRSYGSGRLYTREDRNGQETWYGSFYVYGRRVNRATWVKAWARCHRWDNQIAGREGAPQEDRDSEPGRTPGRRADEHRGGLTALCRARRAARAQALETLENIESETRVHLAPFFRGRTLDAITYEDVLDLLAVLEGKGLSPKSIRNVIATLSELFTFARAPQRRWAASNPCEGIELPAVAERTEIRFLTLEEVRALVANVRHGMYEQLDRTMFLAAAMTGLRKGELVALRWRDVDWTALRVRVRQNYTRGQFGSPKSRRSTRSVPLADELAGELDRLYKTSRWTGEGDLVFAHPVTGKVQPKANISQRFRAALKAAGLNETHRFHDLRHTFGTRMAAVGVPLRTLQEWMGHGDLTTTQIYADYSPSEREAEMVTAAFAEPVVPSEPLTASKPYGFLSARRASAGRVLSSFQTSSAGM